MKDMNPVNTTNADHNKKKDAVDPAYLTKDPVRADTLNNVHQTGEAVVEAGAYFCEAGKKQDFAKGATFPVCPVNGSSTVWRHANHQHKTGEAVLETSHYYCTDGQHLDLNKGDHFPVCPNTGEETVWMHSE
ncbi:hypothetical protein EHS13_03640 [Paenibacillus psychroresistens]|uniref:Uncharacterized protein n=1 Tax=Paenibacillus psychroresistens TaxID=1778678 RepID=A0A6B8RCR3_9BACL|nr:hypothetical protein [Paenibacillus psychroresistens]QGQ94059.1 hypothetical protein EHS13_03640 [Paenibacillus psychroresistens]